MKSSLFDRFNHITSPVHGGTTRSSKVLDYSISVNPYEIPLSVKDAYISSISFIDKYPDTSNRALKKSAADFMGVPVESLLFTNGSAEAFSLIAGLLLEPGKSAYIMSPCYSDYEHVSRINGAGVIIHQLDASRGFEPETEEILNEIYSLKPELIWLCSPNNPTGVILDDEFINSAAERAAEYGGFVVLDEAYSAFSLQKDPGLVKTTDKKNIITVRSMTKDFGVPGLRLGFIYADPELMHLFELYKPCWSVSVPAQMVGEALIAEIDYYKNSWQNVELEHDFLMKEFAECGIMPLQASANQCGIFIFFKTPVVSSAAAFVSAMADQGVIIRDCGSMGASGYCRIGVKSRENNIKFIKALREVVND